VFVQHIHGVDLRKETLAWGLDWGRRAVSY